SALPPRPRPDLRKTPPDGDDDRSARSRPFGPPRSLRPAGTPAAHADIRERLQPHLEEQTVPSLEQPSMMKDRASLAGARAPPAPPPSSAMNSRRLIIRYRS